MIPTALKQGGSVKKVFLTFGPFGADFQGIQQNLAQFKKAIAGVQAITNIDGLDWDFEQDHSQFTGLLVDLTSWANDLGMMVTAAPIIPAGCPRSRAWFPIRRRFWSPVTMWTRVLRRAMSRPASANCKRRPPAWMEDSSGATNSWPTRDSPPHNTRAQSQPA